MAGVSSPCRMCTPAIPKPARAMSACIGCRFTTTARRGCIGRCTRWGRATARRYYERGERMPVAVTLGGDPAYTFAATAPLPDGLDEILFAGFHSREISRAGAVQNDRPRSAGAMSISSSKVMSSRARRGRKDRSAITPVSTPRSRITRSFISPRSRIGATRFIRPPSSAFRRWKIFTWATPASGFSCRSSK